MPKYILPLVQNKMTVTKMCADYEVSSGINVGMIFRWHCRSVLSSLNVPNFSFHANKRKNHLFSDQRLSPYMHFIVDQREYNISIAGVNKIQTTAPDVLRKGPCNGTNVVLFCAAVDLML